ncbi:MAG: hydroxysqualene dehydroxylase [Betaproteobacteria bacterium]|jgi:squalene-associated FAD-dependent desaturase|nr:hydroxysqualene dehydroxylase [Betaproteobacteria bacterium]
MAAAVVLSQRKIPVTVFESGPVPGGRARRILSQGNELDNGQHILVGAYRELFGLMRTVGVPQDAVLRLPLELRYAGNFSLRSRSLPFPFGLLGGLLLARGLPVAERLGAVRFIAALRAAGFRLPQDIAVAELLRRHRQDGAIGHYLWRPLCVSALNTPVAIASSRAFLVVLRDALLGGDGASDLVLPRVDLSRLFPDPASEYVTRHGGEIRLRSPVESLEELKKQYSSVIVAVGPHQLKTLLPAVADGYTYQPIYTCYLQYSESVKLPFPMVGLADGLVQWVFDRGHLLGEKGRLACVISAQGDHQQMSQDEVAATCHRELKQAGLVDENPAWMRVVAEKRATVTCAVGRPTVETRTAGVFLAGDYLDAEYPPTLEAAVRSGVRAANMIA